MRPVSTFAKRSSSGVFGDVFKHTPLADTTGMANITTGTRYLNYPILFP